MGDCLFNLAYLLGSTHVKDSISKHEVEGSCGITPEVALLPPHALAHILHPHMHLHTMQLNTFITYKLHTHKETQTWQEDLPNKRSVLLHGLSLEVITIPLISFLSHFCFFGDYLLVCVLCKCFWVYMWRPENNFIQSVFFFHEGRGKEI